MHAHRTHLGLSVPFVIDARNPTISDPFFCTVHGPFLLVPAGTIVKWHLSLTEFIKFFPLCVGVGIFTHRHARG